MRLATVLFFVLNITFISGTNASRGKYVRNVEGKPPLDKSVPVSKNSSSNVAELDISSHFKKKIEEIATPIINKNITLGSNVTHTSPNSTGVENKLPYLPGMDDRVQSGALMRGFFVLVGVTILLLLYLGVRMFRLKKGHKAPTMVKKYGVLTNRADVEMLPLPLSEDEDDDTVFEINNHMNR